MTYPSTQTLRNWWYPACRGPWAVVSLNGSGKVTVRTTTVEAVKALNAVLKSYKYETRQKDTGAYVCRRITGGTGYSLHAYGIALDINWQSNPYGSTLRTDMRNFGDRRMPERIMAIRTKNGKQIWRWGGTYSGNKDAMHYEVVCSPADLRTGVDWHTVVGYTAPTTYPTLRLGDVKPMVKTLKHRLNVALKTNTLPADETFGGRTEAAVKEVQKAFHLVVDGVCGPKTWDAVNFAWKLNGGN